MKFFIFLLMIATVHAGDENRVWEEGIEVLRNPSNAVNNVLCKYDDPKAPWCKDLHKHACTFKKSTNKLGTLDLSIGERFTKKIQPSWTQQQINDAYMGSIRSAEVEVFGQSLIKRPDVVQVFMDAKTSMRQAITSNPYISQEKQKKMADNVMTINMRTGTEYIDEITSYISKQIPGTPAVDARKSAIELYQSSCGEHGLEVNAFYEKGKFILCPGLVHSLSDYGPKDKNEVLNALSFTIGHEMGHSIDSVEFPEVYSNMRACYVGQTNNPQIWADEMSAEITGDYWGTLVMSNRLRAQGVRGADAAIIASYAVDGFCDQGATPDKLIRVNKTMASFPALREAMLCEGPTKEVPACMISGRVPRGNH